MGIFAMLFIAEGMIFYSRGFKSTMRMQRVFILCCACAWPVFGGLSESSTSIKQSSGTLSGITPPHPGKKKTRHTLQRMRGQLSNMPRTIEKGIRSTSPNPHVQQSRVNPMPAHAPAMPEGPKQEERQTPTDADRFFNRAAKIMTKSWKGNIFVWLPAISTDPNSGPTLGILPVLVLSDSTTHHIEHLLAPSYTYNDLFGQTGTMRYYYYPTDASQLYVNGSISQHTNRELKIRYENPALDDGIYYLRTEAYYSVDGSEHFYGLGPTSHNGQDESGFVSKDGTARAAVGINFFNYWRAAFGTRFRRYDTEQNIIPHTSDAATRFPNTPGFGTNNTVTNEFRLLWDTRDTPITPSRGASGEFFLEKTSQAMGSDADYVLYGGEAKKLFLWKNHPNQITVVHSRYEWANGPFIPFYESPSLGGRESLRAFGDRRFVDRGSVVFNIEQRYIFSSLKLMGIETNFEASPFFDIGSVFPTLPKIERRYFQPAYGVAFRAAVKPNVVGDVEVGYGTEGAAVFVDINYPY